MCLNFLEFFMLLELYLVIAVSSAKEIEDLKRWA